ncbi:hypothetical protein ACOYYE_23605, partial [Escherichia coli]
RSARHQPGVRMRGGDRRGSALCGQFADRQ